MEDFHVQLIRDKLPEDERRRALARAYSFLLSLSSSTEKIKEDTAVDLDQDTAVASQTQPSEPKDGTFHQ